MKAKFLIVSIFLLFIGSTQSLFVHMDKGVEKCFFDEFYQGQVIVLRFEVMHLTNAIQTSIF